MAFHPYLLHNQSCIYQNTSEPTFCRIKRHLQRHSLHSTCQSHVITSEHNMLSKQSPSSMVPIRQPIQHFVQPGKEK